METDQASCWTCFIAATGQSLELQCGAGVSVDEIQQTLASITGIQPSDQILTCHGAPLTPGTSLADHCPPPQAAGEATAPEPRELFLYSKPMLRPDAPLPQPETLPPPPHGYDGSELDSLTARDDTTTTTAAAAAHPLEAAASPLLRALPQYHREFQRHAHQASLAADAGASRVALCTHLIDESEVRALCVDAAMASVEPSYQYICNAQTTFQQHFRQRYALHDDVLGSFDNDIAFLRSVELPLQLREQYNVVIAASSGPAATGAESSSSTTTTTPITTKSITCLANLVDCEALQRLATDCARSHRRFASRVSELKHLHANLRKDVEALFMRAPSVDLAALSQGLENARAAAEEQAAIAQAMHADLKKAEAALEDGAGSSRAGTSTSTGQVSHSTTMIVGSSVQDSIAVLEAIHEAHTSNTLPRIATCAHLIENFAQQCMAGRNALVNDALHALRTIAAHQSKIRAMREALAPFPEALKRQDAHIDKLLAVRRLPAAYKQCLAECARRAAFADKYSAFAADLAERMGKFRSKESSVRDTFRRQVSMLLTDEFLSAMGLDAPPPHCLVTVAPPQGSGEADSVSHAALLTVTPEDLRRLKLPTRRIGSSSIEASTLLPPPATSAAPSQTPPPPPSPSRAGVRSSVFEPTTITTTPTATTTSASLMLENAQLRADLASQIALDCIRVAEMASLAPAPKPPLREEQSRGGSAAATPAGTPRSQSQTQALRESSSSSASSSRLTTSTAAAAAPLAGGGGLAPDAAAKFETALASKDEVIAALREHVAEAEREALRVKERLHALELQQQVKSEESRPASATNE